MIRIALVQVHALYVLFACGQADCGPMAMNVADVHHLLAEVFAIDVLGL